MKGNVYFLNRGVARKSIQMQNEPCVYLIDLYYGFIRIMGVYPNKVKAQRALDGFGIKGVGCRGACKFLCCERGFDAGYSKAAKELLDSHDPKPLIPVAIGENEIYFGFFEDIRVIHLRSER